MSAGSNPLSHVVQHPIKTVPADLGPLTPQGEITVMSDQIAMILGAGLLLMVFLPLLLRRRDDSSLESMVPTGFANVIETICQYLRQEVAEPALGPYTDRFIKYIWSVFFFILTMNLLGLIPIPPISQLFAHVPIGGTATSNIWVTGTLAITTLDACSGSPREAARDDAYPSITRSPNDDRDYRFIHLGNALPVLLISDPDTDKAATGIQ